MRNYKYFARQHRIQLILKIYNVRIHRWLSAKDVLGGARIHRLFFETTIISEIFHLQIQNWKFISQNHEETMENFNVPEIISQNQIGGNSGRRMTPFGNAGQAFIVRLDGDEQPAMAEHGNNEEEIIYGPTRPRISD